MDTGSWLTDTQQHVWRRWLAATARLPAALTLRPFSPALEETVLGAGMPASKSNPHAELFVSLLREAG